MATLAPIRLLLPSECDGSHQHYYHLLLGNILPWHALPEHERSASEWVMCDPGPLAPIVREAGLGLVSQQEFIRLTRSLRRWYRPFDHPLAATSYAHIRPFATQGLDGRIEAVRLEGFDRHHSFPVQMIRRAVASLQARLASPAPDALASPSASAASAEPDIVVVDRDRPDPFYSSKAVRRGSGRDRRSLPNTQEVADALSAAFGTAARRVLLEGMSLSEQAALFQGASLVVAQHGAALTNLIWCSPSARVIEIVPHDPNTPDLSCFRQLSRALGLERREVAQAGPHTPVDVQAVVVTAREMLPP
jgi:hypothetical protein